MGRIAGLFHFDARPIGRDDESWVVTALGSGNRRHPELQRAEGVLMGAIPAARTGEVAGRCLPPGDMCTWDGRLDNREFPYGPDQRTSTTPANHALALYRARGIDGLRDLIGDWSLAIWDAARRGIVLASDYAGIRPLYYYRDSRCLLWSTSLQALAQRTGIQGLDDEYVASFLSGGNAAYRTPYRGIFPVPPGQAVLVTPDRFCTQAFWSLPFQEEVRFEDPRDYQERLRTLFEEAVSVRLNGDSPVCAELSGGLDSSSVVCMAHRIMSSHPDSAGKLITLSYQWGESTDRKYIRAVERAIKSPGIHLDLQQYPFLTAEQPWGAAPAGWGARFAETSRRMSEAGATVLLTGQLGDFLMGGLIDDAEQVVDHLQRGHLVEAVREAFAWSQFLRVPIYSILWRALRTNFSSWSAALEPTVLQGAHDPSDADSFSQGFRRRADLGEIEKMRRMRWQGAAPGQRRRFSIISDTLESRHLQAPEAMQDISFTHPFAHRPLVEFMLTIPPGEVCRPGEPRRLMRRAFAEILPSAIAARQSKASYSTIYRQSLVPLAADLLKQPGHIRLVELGYLDGPSLTRRLTRLSEGLLCNESQLRHVILLEFWLRKWERGAGHPPDPGEEAEPGPPAKLTSVGPPPRS